MRRRHLVELHELSWCPNVLRDGLTDFLEAWIRTRDIYGPIRPLLFREIHASGAQSVVDICSGAGGPWLAWKESEKIDLSVTLTDKFPNEAAISRFVKSPVAGLTYFAESVDATNIPERLGGFRTIFSAFHHFGPTQGHLIIKDAIAKRQPIGIFEFTYRRPAALLSMLLSPLGVWWLAPRARPRSWRKLFFTYVVPLIPLIVTIDGIVSCWRTYTPDELRSMTGESNYQWKHGIENGPNGPITYFIGYPRS